MPIFNLDDNEAQYIVNLLGDRPIREALSIYMKFETQRQQQLRRPSMPGNSKDDSHREPENKPEFFGPSAAQPF